MLTVKEDRNQAEIHISEIDQFLAGRFLDTQMQPRGYTVSMKDRDGTLVIRDAPAPPDAVRDEGVDIELSPSEYLDLQDAGIEEYIDRPVYTSSAYELFDLLFTYFSSFDFIADFTGNAWKIRVFEHVPKKK